MPRVPSDPDPRDPGRRKMLGVVGAAGMAALVGVPRFKVPAFAPPSLSCVVRPEQTEGPYFVDEMMDRSDIRQDPTDGRVVEGLPLRVRISVFRMGTATCTPAAGAQVDLWQCDALGVYAGVEDFQGKFDTRGKQFLRGHQIANRDGTVEFVTIYPGWYEGRTPHLHFKIRVPGAGDAAHEFTSQLYFEEAVTDLVYAMAPYNDKAQRDTKNDDDGIFRRDGSGARLMLDLTEAANGYVGTFGIGLELD